MLSNEIKEQLIEKLRERIEPIFIIIFGSFAKGNVRAESDLDIAYFSHTELNYYERFIVAGELALIVGREVDSRYEKNRYGVDITNICDRLSYLYRR